MSATRVSSPPCSVLPPRALEKEQALTPPSGLSPLVWPLQVASRAFLLPVWLLVLQALHCLPCWTPLWVGLGLSQPLPNLPGKL